MRVSVLRSLVLMISTALCACITQTEERDAQAAEKLRVWIAGNAVSLTSTDPLAPRTDLAAFGNMVGDAHVVGLGEGTHGTREFNTQRHRYIRHLVETKGFTHVAIEGTSADAELINHFVLTGQGDPAKLLAALRFWTINTQEVLDLIKWIRQWNTTVPTAAHVQFYGFDFQQPGPALDSVEAYIRRVDPSNTSFVRSRYLCLDAYKSYGAKSGASLSTYSVSASSVRLACAQGTKEVNELLARSKDVYVATSSADQYERALHATRLVQQWEAFGSGFTDLSKATYQRDSSMFENVQWIRARGGPNSKIVLWAHNAHVSRSGQMLGGLLSRTLGTDYIAMGFAFGEGTFNAVSDGGLRTIRPATVPSDWIEARFAAAKPSDFLLDLRLVARGGSDAAPLLKAFKMRSVGSTFSSSTPSGSYGAFFLTKEFDLITYLHTTTASQVLPFVY